MADKALFVRVAEHREIFFRYAWVDYSAHKPGSFRLVPPVAHFPNWKADYEAMRGPMFFGEAPPFDEIIRVVREFEKTFNSTV
jgi:hypothetical protein